MGKSSSATAAPAESPLLLTRLFVVSMLLEFLQNAALLQLLVEPLECPVDRLVLLNLHLDQSTRFLLTMPVWATDAAHCRASPTGIPHGEAIVPTALSVVKDTPVLWHYIGRTTAVSPSARSQAICHECDVLFCMLRNRDNGPSGLGKDSPPKPVPETPLRTR